VFLLRYLAHLIWVLGVSFLGAVVACAGQQVGLAGRWQRLLAGLRMPGNWPLKKCPRQRSIAPQIVVLPQPFAAQIVVLCHAPARLCLLGSQSAAHHDLRLLLEAPWASQLRHVLLLPLLVPVHFVHLFVRDSVPVPLLADLLEYLGSDEAVFFSESLSMYHQGLSLLVALQSRST
jgi:hypothetical protein